MIFRACRDVSLEECRGEGDALIEVAFQVELGIITWHDLRTYGAGIGDVQPVLVQVAGEMGDETPRGLDVFGFKFAQRALDVLVAKVQEKRDRDVDGVADGMAGSH